jgi:hypothetical protein
MAFNLPLQNHFNRTTGPATYSRPSDWPVITDVATEVQFLFCDLGDAACSIRTTFTRTSGTQNIIIDWGDGTTNTVTTTASTDTNKTYTPGTGTPCSLSNCNIMAIFISGDVASPQNCAVLEAYYGDSTQNVTRVNFNSSGLNGDSLSAYVNLQFVKLPITVSWSSWGTMFYQCTSLLKVVMPTSNSAMTAFNQVFQNCNALLEITLPSNSTGITTLSSCFNNCTNLRSVTFPTTLNSCSTLSSIFSGCSSLTSVTLPTSMSACTNFSSMFAACRSISSITLPNTVSASTTTFGSCFSNCVNLKTCVLPGSAQLSLVTEISGIFSWCANLTTLTNFEKIGSLTATPRMNGFSIQQNRFASGSAISFSGPLSTLQLQGIQSTIKANVQAVRLLNTSAGQWTGSSPQINVSFTNMSTAQIVQLFTDMAAQGNVVSKTINITSATGAAGLTLANRQIITTKGWTITG